MSSYRESAFRWLVQPCDHQPRSNVWERWTGANVYSHYRTASPVDVAIAVSTRVQSAIAPIGTRHFVVFGKPLYRLSTVLVCLASQSIL